MVLVEGWWGGYSVKGGDSSCVVKMVSKLGAQCLKGGQSGRSQAAEQMVPAAMACRRSRVGGVRDDPGNDRDSDHTYPDVHRANGSHQHVLTYQQRLPKPVRSAGPPDRFSPTPTVVGRTDFTHRRQHHTSSRIIRYHPISFLGFSGRVAVIGGPFAIHRYATSPLSVDAPSPSFLSPNNGRRGCAILCSGRLQSARRFCRRVGGHGSRGLPCRRGR